MIKMFKNKKGITLIELLLIIAIIAVLAAAIFVAVDPAKRFVDSRNATRWQDVSETLGAVLRYASDNSGSYPSAIDNSPSTVQVLGSGGVGNCSVCNGESVVVTGDCADMSPDLVDKYLSAMPSDPLSDTDFDTQYFINKTVQGRIIVGACAEENGVKIYVQR